MTVTDVNAARVHTTGPLPSLPFFFFFPSSLHLSLLPPSLYPVYPEYNALMVPALMDLTVNQSQNLRHPTVLISVHCWDNSIP